MLDEPTTGLDVQAFFQLLDIIRNFIREGGTVILVTHHVHEILPEVGSAVETWSNYGSWLQGRRPEWAQFIRSF